MRERYQDATTNARDYRFSSGNPVSGLEEAKKQGYGEIYNENNAYFGAYADDLPHGEGLLSFSEYMKRKFHKWKTSWIKPVKGREIISWNFRKGERLSGILKTSEITYEETIKGNKIVTKATSKKWKLARRWKI